MQPHYIEFITVGFGIVLLMLEAFTNGNKSKLGLIAAGGLAVILILQLTVPGDATVPDWLSRFYGYGAASLFYKMIALVSTILVLLLAVDYKKVLSRYTSGDESCSGLGEFYCLPVFACAGLMWMASAIDLVSIFVALELVTITFYVMVAYMRRNVGSLEAGVKYLILGALSTGFLVYGIAWMYGAMGTTSLDAMAVKLMQGHSLNSTYLLFGLALMILALGFKIGAVPMQLWIPDVYQGAPTPITAYLSVASKAAGFFVLYWVLYLFLDNYLAKEISGKLVNILSIIAGATLLYGNLAAINQTNFKRLLAYSSIAHAGFLTMAVAAISFQSMSFYLGIYLIMTFAAFYILALVRVADDSEDIDTYDGLAKRNPLLAACLTLVMAAMAGIPLTAGFWGKFFVFQAAINAGLSWWLMAVAFISVAAGFYYYLKIVKAMYWHAPRTEKAIEVPVITKSVLAVLTVGILLFGIWPTPVLNLLTLIKF